MNGENSTYWLDIPSEEHHELVAKVELTESKVKISIIADSINTIAWSEMRRYKE